MREVEKISETTKKNHNNGESVDKKRLIEIIILELVP